MIPAPAKRHHPNTYFTKVRWEKTGYALNQWLYLKRYIDNSLYSIDNNQVKREIRTVAVDRKALSFNDIESGTDASAILFSITMTCITKNVEPYSYLRHVLIELPQREVGCDISDLLLYSNRLLKSLVGRNTRLR
ncbi:IS66 family transposase [Photobacterium leiognathi]|uniref:IS66 family transposase n=1 Tax=Photobacterium leiognathi TaxID=553611 RepID=UPI003AF3598D